MHTFPPVDVRLRTTLAIAAAAFLLASESMAALGYGHARARTRWYSQEPAEDMDAGVAAEEEDSTASLTEPPLEATDTKAIGGNAGERMLPRRRSEGIRLPSNRDGYLAYGPPSPLRFSDDAAAGSRPPSPALPEFTMMSKEYVPYLIESPLPEDARNDPALLSEIVVDLEPHKVLSGVIDTTRISKEEKVETFNLEENRTVVLKPQDVLIFFETDGVRTTPQAVIPFSPVPPSAETIKSSAKFTTE